MIPGDEEICEIEATVTTGAEHIAKEEAWAKLKIDGRVEQGRILLNVPVSRVTEILSLRCVDNLYVIVHRVADLDFSREKEKALEQIISLVPSIDWTMGLKMWSKFISFPHPVLPIPCINQEHEQAEYKSTLEERCIWRDRNMKQTSNSENVNTEDTHNHIKTEQKAVDSDLKNNCTKCESENGAVNRQSNRNPYLPSFRATCHRTGPDHSFHSPDAAQEFGGAIFDYFCWNVDLKHHDIEVVLNINKNKVYVALALTKASLHRRDITHFGKTTLRATICAAMLRMCHIMPGDVVCDPMCGTGAITIEGMVANREGFHICADITAFGCEQTYKNMSTLNQSRMKDSKKVYNANLLQWDVTKLPLRDNSVDVFVTDLPFGKRSGSKMMNWTLYPSALNEMARVCQLTTGRACLLTQDKKCMNKTLMNLKDYWKPQRTTFINHGGLRSTAIYLLQRTSKLLAK